jgi:replicative DNA helicase
MQVEKPNMAERSVLGSALMSSEAAATICELLKPEHFLTPTLRKVFLAVRYSLEKGLNIDTISMNDLMKDRVEVDNLFLYLQSLTEDCVITSVRDHCEIVKNNYARDQLGRLALSVSDRIGEGRSADDVIRYLDDEIIKLQQEADSTSLTGGKISAKDMFDQFGQWLDQGEAESYFPFPYPKFNEAFMGYSRGEVVTIFGYSSDGKSVSGFEYLEPLTLMPDLKLGVFSLEMSSLQLARRMMASKTEPFWQIRNKDLTNAQLKNIKDRASSKSGLNMDIYNGQRDSVQIARDTLRNKYDVILVDHLHRMPYKNRMELEEHVRNLKSLAIRANCAVIMLAQTARAKTSDRANAFPEPTTNQLRDTDIITMESDWAQSVWQKRDSNGTRMPGSSILRMQKARDGEADTFIDCVFKPNLMKFVAKDDGSKSDAAGYSEVDNTIPNPIVGTVF